MKPPFPSSPTRPPVAGIYWGRFYNNFGALYSARAFLLYLIDNYGPYDQEEDALYFEAFKVSTNGVGPSITTILNYKPTPKEAAWQLPECFFIQASALKSPHKDTRPKEAVQAPKPSGPVVTLSDFPLKPATCRQLLRKAGIIKPGKRWEWPKDHKDLIKVKKVLRS